jgi:hypothetical protein
VDFVGRLAARSDEILGLDSKILNEALKLTVDKLFESVVDSGVLEAVLLSVFKHDAVFVDKVYNWVFPGRRG